MNVSFDFDSTLSEGDVQWFVRNKLPKQYIVWIVTSRLPDYKAPSDNWNNDLWFIADRLDIPPERVIFTSYSSKHEFFWDKDFLFHLDDDEEEVRMINAMTNCKGILKQKGWEDVIKKEQ